MLACPGLCYWFNSDTFLVAIPVSWGYQTQWQYYTRPFSKRNCRLCWSLQIADAMLHFIPNMWTELCIQHIITDVGCTEGLQNLGLQIWIDAAIYPKICYHLTDENIKYCINMLMQGTNLLNYYLNLFCTLTPFMFLVTTPYFCKLVFFIHSWY